MKISKKEQIDSIVKTLDINDDAIDYIKNNILTLHNVHKLSPSDTYIVEELNLNKYIQTSLEYLENCYIDRLKALGYRYKKKRGE